MINIEDIAKLKYITAELQKSNIKVDDGTWLDHLNPSQAFLTCIGAGPWKIGRRSLIQRQAIEGLGNKDLSEIDDVSIFKYPLDWQNKKVAAIVDYLKRYKITMVYFVKFISDMRAPTKMLYEITNTKGRAKVLDLFVRDYIKAPSFPIDRWVLRVLKENNLPQNEDYMIALCQAAGLEPGYVARLFVSSGGFTGNGEIKTF